MIRRYLQSNTGGDNGSSNKDCDDSNDINSEWINIVAVAITWATTRVATTEKATIMVLTI